MMKFTIVLLLATLISSEAKTLQPSNEPLDIYEGYEAILGDVPHQVLLQIPVQQTGYVTLCGGSIISPNYVLTAAHCFDHFNGYSFEVLAGVINRRDMTNSVQSLWVIDLKIHETYNFGSRKDDIALLKLEGSFNFNNIVKAIPLPSQGEVIDGECLVSGWGRTEKGESSDFLRTATVSIFPDSDCRLSMYFRSESEICGGNENSFVDACRGDSGGPLTCNGVVAGVVSRGPHCGNSTTRPGIYTEVAFYRDWIDSKMV